MTIGGIESTDLKPVKYIEVEMNFRSPKSEPDQIHAVVNEDWVQIVLSRTAEGSMFQGIIELDGFGELSEISAQLGPDELGRSLSTRVRMEGRELVLSFVLDGETRRVRLHPEG